MQQVSVVSHSVQVSLQIQGRQVRPPRPASQTVTSIKLVARTFGQRSLKEWRFFWLALRPQTRESP